MRTRQLLCFLTAALALLLFSFASYGEGRPFITRWKGEAGKELRIPINGWNYKLIIKRASDGSVLKTDYSNYSYSYTPTEDGELLVEAGPEGVSSIRMDEGRAEALLRVEQFGTVEWQTMGHAFHGCKNMQFAEGIDTPDLSQVTNMNDMFSGCTSFNQPLNNWDVSQVTDMSGMFAGCTAFNQPLNSWNVSNVQRMSDIFGRALGMFLDCSSFNQPLDNWDVSKVEVMGEMFAGCTAFDQDLGMWKLERCQGLGLDNCGMSVENYSNSLVGWAAQTNINQNLQLNAGGLKYNASAKAARKQLREGKNWRIRGDADENARPFITRWKGERGKELRIPINGNDYKLIIKRASDGSVLKTDYSNYSYSYTPTEDGELLVEAGSEGVSSISMNEGSAEALLRVEQFGTVEWQTMALAFLGCKNMQFAEGIDTPNLSQVTDMSNMFSGCTSFNQPLNNWDVSQVTDMSDMFKSCTSFNQDLGMWKLERCQELGLDNCGMSVENYSKSLVGWAAQTNINRNLQLNAGGLKYNASAKAARKQLIEGKDWHIRGDADENNRPFITRWKGEAGKELRIPINGYSYKLIIKKASDGSVLVTENNWDKLLYSYTPTEDGELLVEAGPEGVSSIWMNESSCEALLRVEQFGTVKWESMRYAFQGCTNLQFAEGIDTPDLSQVTNMNGMFSGCISFNQPLNNWDVSQVTDMSGMFAGCTAFNQPLNSWNVSNVQKMGRMSDNYDRALGMFQDCSSFNQPLNNWNVSQVTSMSDMFNGCTSFNQDLGMWKLERCRELGLDNCGMSVENYSKSLEGWAAQTNIKQGLQLSAVHLRYNASGKAARVKLISEKSWRIFGDSDIDVVAKPFITRWKGEAGKELRIPIYGRYYKLVIKKASDNTILKNEPSLTIDRNSYMVYRFTPTEDGELLIEAGPVGVSFIRMDGGSAEALLRVEQFGTVEWQTMENAFRGCKNMQFAEGIDTPNLSQVRYMSDMFSGCTSFNQPLNNWNLSQVRDMSDMFSGCTSFNQSLNNWDVSQVTYMSGMFAGCTAFNQPLNSWNVSNVQWMGRTSDNSDRALGMFQGCSSFNQPLDNWDVSQVRGMGDMFARCISFDQDLGMWKLEKCGSLGLNLCGMSVENYSNSLVGWAAQPNINDGLHLDADELSYNEAGKTARTKLKVYKHWTITGDEKASHSIAFVPNRLTLNPAEEKNLVLKKTEIEDQEEVTLTSSDPETVQIVDAASFKIKGLKLGKATITARIASSATHGELIAKCEVSVRVVVTGVSLSQTELTLEKGAKATLVATVVPANATNKNVSWHSDNVAIATVEDGVVTAVAEGQTSVHVFTEDGNITTECKVIVKKNGGSNPSVTVTGVKLSQNKLTLKKDDSFTLVATVEPNNASTKAVTWSSDNAAVATVSDAGLVEAKTVGTATITVTTQDGGFTATCEVTVTAEDVVLTGLRLSPSETRLKVGEEATLSVTYEPAGATQREVTWSTSAAAIVTVDEHGKVKAIAAGEATITVASKTNASIQATCKVIVEPATAVEDAIFANVLVAPNPFDNQLRIVNGDLRGTYALLNAQGIVVRSGNMTDNEVLIETSDLTSGLYLLRLTAENGATKTITVVKER